ncbi:MAG TPA: hypothetical protein VIY08_12590 [Candidatus Nitrosocosmicus sp.]
MSLTFVKLDNCTFPIDYLYDVQNFTWAKVDDVHESRVDVKNIANKSSIVTVGITPILSYISGNIKKIKLKSIGDTINKDKSLGTIESLSYFGVIRSPISGKIIEINTELLTNPKRVNDYPFEGGWIAKIKPFDVESLGLLKSVGQCKNELQELIKKFNVKCFKMFPDFELYELGTECSATLAKLGDFMDEKMENNQIIHLVSDDPTADLEVSRWVIDNKQELVEIMIEKNQPKNSSISNYIFHILIKKLC